MLIWILLHGKIEDKKLYYYDEIIVKNVKVKIIWMYTTQAIKNYETSQMIIYMFYVEYAIWNFIQSIIYEKVWLIKPWTLFIENDGEKNKTYILVWKKKTKSHMQSKSSRKNLSDGKTFDSLQFLSLQKIKKNLQS